MIDPKQVENIFFQGGSVKGTAYIGAVRKLMQHVDFATVKRFAGTSAGSIGAALLAIGFTVDELNDTLFGLEFEKFLDGNLKDFILRLKDKPTAGSAAMGVFSHPSAASQASSRLRSSFGLCPGEYFRLWLEEKITCKIKGMSETDYASDPEKNALHLTFLELHQLAERDAKTFKDLYVITVNVTTGHTEILSHETAPNVIISDAVRCSMSIPLLFLPHQLFEKTASGRQVQNPDMLYVDGGLTNNYKADLFDHVRYIEEQRDKSITHKVFNPHTLGLKLCSKQNKDYFDGVTEAKQQDIKKFIPFIMAMVRSMHHKQDDDFVDANDRQRTIIIDTLDVDTLDFDLSEDKKHALIESGSAGVDAYFSASASAVSSSDIAIPLPVLDMGLFMRIAPLFASVKVETSDAGVRLSECHIGLNPSNLVYELYADGSPSALQLAGALKLNVNSENSEGEHALDIAFKNTNAKVIAILIRMGANACASDIKPDIRISCKRQLEAGEYSAIESHLKGLNTTDMSDASAAGATAGVRR